MSRTTAKTASANPTGKRASSAKKIVPVGKPAQKPVNTTLAAIRRAVRIVAEKRSRPDA